jgi:pyruvate,water dikinase
MENQHQFKFVKWLNELRQQDLLLVGGKGANLGVLSALGFPVPHGFCVTTEAFQYFSEKVGLESKVSAAMNSLNIDDYQQLRKTSQALRDFVRSHRIPVEVKREIQEAYQILSQNDEEPAWVAVRSSATSEDQPDKSFAGQLETYLNLRGGQNVIEAVLKCWAALFTERVVAYRGKAGFSHTDASMGVVVQEMVDATKSGVMFTIDPATKDRSKILIEATIGLAEPVVGGTIIPDTYLVDKPTLEVVEQHVGTKKRVVLRNPIGGGVIKIETPQGQERKLCLAAEEVRRIAEFGRQIEAKYNNTPQDIEWAISEGRIYILQTRPVTGLRRTSQFTV